MAEVGFGKGRTSLWAALAMGVCFEVIGVLWLVFSCIEVFTMSVLPRLSPLSDTKTLLLYPAVLDLIFRFMSLGNM